MEPEMRTRSDDEDRSLKEENAKLKADSQLEEKLRLFKLESAAEIEQLLDDYDEKVRTIQKQRKWLSAAISAFAQNGDDFSHFEMLAPTIKELYVRIEKLEVQIIIKTDYVLDAERGKVAHHRTIEGLKTANALLKSALSKNAGNP